GPASRWSWRATTPSSVCGISWARPIPRWPRRGPSGASSRRRSRPTSSTDPTRRSRRPSRSRTSSTRWRFMPASDRLGGSFGWLGRRALLAALAILLGSIPALVSAEGAKIRVGVLKLTSSAPIFLGVERGTFREFGIEPELVYFQAAQPVAVALAAGEIDVGATGLTAGLYNVVAGGEKVWVVADKGREWPGYPLTA